MRAVPPGVDVIGFGWIGSQKIAAGRDPGDGEGSVGHGRSRFRHTIGSHPQGSPEKNIDPHSPATPVMALAAAVPDDYRIRLHPDPA